MTDESFRDLRLLKSYYSDRQNILADFYIPVLSRSVSYKRIAGFFSSSALAVAARGIAGLVRRKGRIQLITSAKLSQNDAEAVRNAVEDPLAVIERAALQALESIQDRLEQDHVAGLAWMLAMGRLEMRIALIVDSEGNPIDPELLATIGILHQKIGIFEDPFGDFVSFSGSINESKTAWLYNLEQFKVYRSWIPEEKDYLEEDREAFERLWNNNSQSAVVYDLPEAVKGRILEHKPESVEELERVLAKMNQGIETLDRAVGNKTLWPHQAEAVEEWIENGYRGIMEMATGTGKTLAALGGLESLRSKTNPLVTVISTPYQHLTSQWIDEVSALGIDGQKVIADSDHPKWHRNLKQELLDINLGVTEHLMIFTTHDTLASQRFARTMGGLQKDVLLIVDEVHAVGSPVRKEGLADSYQYRLGLSATPRRWFDDIGTDRILDYFGSTVYEFPLSRAINSINPSTGQTYLCPYEYNLILVSLSQEELEEYEALTHKISRMYHAAKNDEELQQAYELLCIGRARIVTNAESKYQAFETLLDELLRREMLHHCLVYCSPQQIERAQEIMVERGLKQHRFTQHEGTKRCDEFGGISERDLLLQDLANGSLDALVSMKCLDEGVDVPPARVAVILASSGNPREYIQRRGRVLRRYPGKEMSHVYDFVVSPSPFDGKNPEIDEMERRVFTRELERCREFARTAVNATVCLTEIDEMLEIVGDD